MDKNNLKLHLNLSDYFEPIDSNPTLEVGTEIMNYFNTCVDILVLIKKFINKI
jgi:hypothetical protein